MFKLPKALARILLLLILILPFVLREISKTLEAYPAVLLPSGDSVVSTSDGVVVFGRSELVAVRSDGSEELLDPDALFGDIPGYYWTRIASREFGLKAENRKSLAIGAWAISAVVSPQATVQQQQQFQEWMVQRLEELNLSQISRVRVRHLKVFFDIDTRTEVKQEVTSYFDVEINR